MEINGTHYHEETPKQVITILERYRVAKDLGRLRMYYGDAQTGKAWGDVEEGYIGRSMGRVKIPLVVHNTRSLGGAGLLDHCIVRIETARGKRVLYSHTTFHED